MNSQSPGILKDLEEKVKKKNIQLWQLEQMRFFFCLVVFGLVFENT